MAGRKKLFKNYIKERCIKNDSGDIATYSFKDLKEEEIPKMQDIDRLVYHAYDVFRKKFIPYKIKSYRFEPKINKVVFEVNDYYRSVEDGIVTESLGATRIFYQSDLVLLPEDYVSKKLRSVS